VLLVLWEYQVRPGQAVEFESLYRPDGPWTELLRQSPGFLSTTLWHDRVAPLRYMVADRWTSEMAYDDFLTRFSDQYTALSARGRQSWDREVLLGRFELLD
jgi:heme-degrading monooxygenase HmoA